MGDSSDLGKTAWAVASLGTSYVVDEAIFAAPRRQGRAYKREAGARREARDISTAQQENERQGAIRQKLRQERIRRAQVVSAAEAAGVSGSSVEASTIGSGQTLTASGAAFASGATLSNNLQSDLLQRAADFNLGGQQAALRGQQFKSAFDLGVKAYTAIG